MFPKLANHFLHGSTRLMKNQTQTAQFRTVLQFSPSYPPSPLPPTTPYQPNSILAHTHGAGSSRSNENSSDSRGNRFYEGYTGPGRAVTQANAYISSYDGATRSAEELEEIEPSRRKSNSLLPFEDEPRSYRDTDERNHVTRGSSMFPGVDSSRHRRLSDLRNALGRPTSVADVLENRVVLEQRRHRHSSTTVQAVSNSSQTQTPLPSKRTSPKLLKSSPPRQLLSILPQGKETEYAEEILLATKSRDIPRLLELAVEITSFEWSKRELRRLCDRILSGICEIDRWDDSLEPIFGLYQHLRSKGVQITPAIYARLISALSSRERQLQQVAELFIETKRFDDNSALEDYTEQINFRIPEERNFYKAMDIVKEAISENGFQLYRQEVDSLLSVCVWYRDTESANYLFNYYLSNVETNNDFYPNIYGNMIKNLGAVKDVDGALRLFTRFRSVREPLELHGRKAAVPWNEMIACYFGIGQPEEAIGLLEEMLKPTVDESMIPAPTKQTYTSIIKGFSQMNDLKTVQKWFDRLMLVENPSEDGAERLSEASGSISSLQTPRGPLSPSFEAYTNLLTAHANSDDFEGFVKYYGAMPNTMRRTRHLLILSSFSSNTLSSTSISDPQVDFILSYLTNSILCDFSNPKFAKTARRHTFLILLQRTFGVLTRFGRVSMSASFFKSLQEQVAPSSAADLDLDQSLSAMFPVLLEGVSVASGSSRTEELALEALLDIVRLGSGFGMKATESVSFSKALLEATIRYEDVNTLSEEDVAIILTALQMLRNESFITEGYASTITSKLNSTVVSEPNSDSRSPNTSPSVPASNLSDTNSIHTPLNFEFTLNSLSLSSDIFSSLPSANIQTHRISEDISHFIDAACKPGRRNRRPLRETVEVLRKSIKNGLYPSPLVISRYLPSLSREGLYREAEEVYNACQPLLESMSDKKTLQAQGWVQIEDGMMGAAAIAGEIDASNVHRKRIIDQGGAPSSASYAALILSNKSSTDEAGIAMTLFNESRLLGVRLSTYLCNVVMSALSRARRADEALSVFGMMQHERVPCTIVSYSVVIGACCKANDEVNARRLYNEIVALEPSKLNATIFNPMMQLYIQLRADRAQGAHYYNELIRYGARPTAHTYKLLLDCWGTIAPANLSMVESTFRSLEIDPDVTVDGTHFASLLTAYGCVAKDLDKAISIFDSLATYGSGKNRSLPDAACWEAMFDVLVANRRDDLLRKYIAKFKSDGAPMTAYIANLIIKGLSQNGDVDGARLVFEAMHDPPTGLAGHNRSHGDNDHATPHSKLQNVPYREPSTWESMIRAELGASQLDRAQDLLNRMITRDYPTAVLERVRRLVNPVDGDLQVNIQIS